MRFSIIVPVYNIKEYLSGCVDSLLDQTVIDHEIILVDDGSDDGSGILCDEYAAQYPDRVFVIHKVNSGQSDARNEGIRAAKGEYLIFVDGDDYVSEEMINRLSSCIDHYQPDVVLSDGYYLDLGGSTDICSAYFGHENRLFATGAEAVSLSAGQGPDWQPWGKAFCRKFWLNQDLWFPSGRQWEDFCIIDQVILGAGRVAVADPFYHYVSRPGSTINSVKSSKITDTIYAIDEWQRFWVQNDYPNSVEWKLRHLQAQVYVNTAMGYVSLLPHDERKKLMNEVKKYRYILGDYRGVIGVMLRIMTRTIGFGAVCSIIGLRKRIRYGR